MPAARRQIVSGKVYELEVRTRRGLPFPALALVRLLLASAMARTQRDAKVSLSHFLWMANHLHLILVAKDAQQCVNFYAELMKKITDYFKRLLGFEHLELWEAGGPTLSQILDVESLESRLEYIYLNPVRANLVESIDEYPGFSSWETFTRDAGSGEESELVPWVRQPTIPRLGRRTVSRSQDRALTQGLREKNKKQVHALTVTPAAAYQAFGVWGEEEVARFKKSLIARVRNEERELRRKRATEGRRVMGSARLRDEPLLKPHTPKRERGDRKVLFHTSLQELAIAYLEQFASFCKSCREAYLAWRAGDHTVAWPPGAFRPPLSPWANAIA